MFGEMLQLGKRETNWISGLLGRPARSVDHTNFERDSSFSSLVCLLFICNNSFFGLTDRIRFDFSLTADL